MNIPEGVTILEESSFMRCSNLERVELPSTLEIIEESTFFEVLLLSYLYKTNMSVFYYIHS